MKHLYFLCFLVITMGGTITAQSDVIFTHFMFNKLNYNPGFTGNAEALDVGAIYRNQWWSGIEGAPRTLNVFGHSPINNTKSSVGLSITSDEIGFYNTLVFRASYAYKIPFKNKSKLSLGISARAEQTKTDWKKAKGVDPSDVLAGSDDTNMLAPNFGFGAYYNAPKYFLGLSIPRLVKNSLYSDDANFEFALNTLYLMGGVTIPLNSKIELMPNALISFNNRTPFEFDVNINALFLKKFMAGVSYRYQDSFDALIQYYFNQGFRIGAALDFTTSDLSTRTTGSFEVLLGYTLPCKDCNIIHPRFL